MSSYLMCILSRSWTGNPYFFLNPILYKAVPVWGNVYNFNYFVTVNIVRQCNSDPVISLLSRSGEAMSTISIILSTSCEVTCHTISIILSRQKVRQKMSLHLNYSCSRSCVGTIHFVTLELWGNPSSNISITLSRSSAGNVTILPHGHIILSTKWWGNDLPCDAIILVIWVVRQCLQSAGLAMTRK